MHSSSILVASSQPLFKLTLSTLESIRNETPFDAIFKTILKKKKEYLQISQLALPPKRHAPIRFAVDEAEPEYPSTVEDRHRRLYYEAIALASLNS